MDGYCNRLEDAICQKLYQKKMLQGLDSQSTARKSNGHFHPEVRFAYPRNLFGSREMTFFFLFSVQVVLGSTP